MSAVGCTHLNQYKEEKGTSTFRIIHAYFVACVAKDSRKTKVHNCYCYTCHTRSKRLHACLSCVYFGCYFGKHIQEHAETTEHLIAVDISFGTVYCYACKDYVYDKELEAISRKQRIRSAKQLGVNLYFPWDLVEKKQELIEMHPKQLTSANKSYIGLRGLVNLGHTCFMNCILQALMHTPLLRDFFLSDRHVCQLQNDPSMCLVCEMSSLFQEFYSGKSTPHIPFRLLHLVWTHAKHLANYCQQDAHEFFIAILDVLHQHFRGTNGMSSSYPHHCNCIIHQIFTGGLQSDVVCKACNAVSTTIDPFMDISLDLGAGSHITQLNTESTREAREDSKRTTLLKCLERFTQPEYLGSLSVFKCGSCQKEQSTTKQLTMKKLPVVASFHLKRLEHSMQNVHGFKNKTHVSFPEFLDMTPFTSSYLRKPSPSNSSGEKLYNFCNSENEYCLFAVVNHIGNIEGGHFIAFIRQGRDQWFKCDDHAITSVTVEEVLGSEGYILFYHKKIPEYE